MTRPEYLKTRNGLMVKVISRFGDRIIGHLHEELENRVWVRGRKLFIADEERDHPLDLVDEIGKPAVDQTSIPGTPVALFIGVQRKRHTNTLHYVAHESEDFLRTCSNVIAIIPVTINWKEGEGL